MTIANAFKLFFKAFTGKEPVGNNIADVIRDGANGMGEGVILKSSTASSKKLFKITVDDTGEITATEVTG